MIRKLIIFILFLLLSHSMVFSQETTDKFNFLIENGAKMIRENDFGKVLHMIEELPSFRKADFRIRVLENFAYLKGYLVTKRKEDGKKWQEDYKPICYTRDKSAIPILMDLLKDNDPYIRAFTLRALGFLGDQTALEAIRGLANQDPNQKVRQRAREAYKRLTGYDLP